MAKFGPPIGASREREVARENYEKTSVVSEGLKDVIVAAVAEDIVHTVDFSNRPRRDPNEIVEIATPFFDDVA